MDLNKLYVETQNERLTETETMELKNAWEVFMTHHEDLREVGGRQMQVIVQGHCRVSTDGTGVAELAVIILRKTWVPSVDRVTSIEYDYTVMLINGYKQIGCLKFNEGEGGISYFCNYTLRNEEEPITYDLVEYNLMRACILGGHLQYARVEKSYLTSHVNYAGIGFREIDDHYEPEDPNAWIQHALQYPLGKCPGMDTRSSELQHFLNKPGSEQVRALWDRLSTWADQAKVTRATGEEFASMQAYHNSLNGNLNPGTRQSTWVLGFCRVEDPSTGVFELAAMTRRLIPVLDKRGFSDDFIDLYKLVRLSDKRELGQLTVGSRYGGVDGFEPIVVDVEGDQRICAERDLVAYNLFKACCTYHIGGLCVKGDGVNTAGVHFGTLGYVQKEEDGLWYSTPLTKIAWNMHARMGGFTRLVDIRQDDVGSSSGA